MIINYDHGDQLSIVWFKILLILVWFGSVHMQRNS